MTCVCLCVLCLRIAFWCVPSVCCVPHVARICFWQVLTVTGHLRRETQNELVTICDGTKFNEGSSHVGTFDRTGGGGEGGGGGGGDAGDAAGGDDDVRHGFVVFQLVGSSSFRSTTVHVTVKLVPIGE